MVGQDGDGGGGEGRAEVSARDARLSMSAETTSVATARRFVRRTLAEWGADSLVDTAALLVSELVTNAVLHARSAPEMVVRLADGRLRIEVRDGSSLVPARKRYGLYAGTGRGIGLVEELSADWGSAVDGDGKVVWFELDQRVAAGDDRPGHAAAAGFAADPADAGSPRPRGQGASGPADARSRLGLAS